MTLSRRALFRSAIGAAALLPMTRIARGETAHRITVIHMNDFHARHDPVDAGAMNCRKDPAGKPEASCFGGSARLATAIARTRAEAEAGGRSVLLLDAGDQFQGSLYYIAWHGEVELAVMHALGTDVMALGNHEFDNGPETLGRFIRAARFPVVSANVDVTGEPALAGLVKHGTMLIRDGLPIGITGATTMETLEGSSPGRNVGFAEPSGPLADAASLLRGMGAKLVIALSHLGVEEDRALAGVVPGIDVIVGGHSHTLLSDSEPGAAGPAHQVFDGAEAKTVVVQAACFGRYLGRLDIDVAADGTVLAYGGDTRHVGLDLPEEPRVAAIVAGYAAQLDTVRGRVVGRAAAPIGADCRTGECAFGDFIADAMLASAHGADVALMNGGGIRTGLPAGAITLGDVLTALPFGNTVATLGLRGADLVAALENGLGRAGAGGFPQVAGMRLKWRPEAAVSARLATAEVREPDGSYAPLDPMRVYRVVTNNFVRRGGDGYEMMLKRAIDPYDAGPGLDVVVMMAIAAAGSALEPATDGRIASLR